MSSLLLRRLTAWMAPGLLLAFASGVVFSPLAPFPKILASVSVILTALASASLLLRREVVTPLETLRKAVTKLRSGTGALPKDLAIQRADDIGLLAREIALLAGERNVWNLRCEESESKVAALTDAISDAIFRIDRDGLILDHQPPKDVPHFLPLEPLEGRKLKEVLPEAVTDRCVEALARVFVDDARQHFEFVLTVDGELRSYQARFARASRNEALTIVRDTTRQKRSADSQARLNRILDATLDPLVTATTEGEIRYINPAGRELLGIGSAGLEELRLGDFMPEWARRQIFRIAIPAALEDGAWEGESALLTHGAIEIPIAITAIPHRSDAGEVELLSFIARDQTERKRFNDHLTFLADHDPLTSLYTRRRFVEELGREIARARRSGAGGAVLLVDLDDFKYVNDSLGHRTGDRLLASLAQLLSKLIRANDTLARLDGDEFAILITETQPSRVDFVVERLLKSIRNHFVHLGEQPVGVTASVGVAFFPEQAANAEELLARADQALDRAKHQGRDQFVVYKPDENWQARVDSRLSGEKLIREALARGRFVLYAQPILDLKSNQIVQFEILLRMLDEQNRILLPAAFLSTAERFGLIRSVDRWVLRQVIRLMGRRRRGGHRVCLSVNLSGKSLGDLELTTLIEKELAENGVDPGQLTLEITETTAIADTERAKIFALALKQIGCRLALDDFGVGFSSMNHLKHLPIDYLKIDGSFIRDLPNNKVDQHLVRAMVEVARALRKRTVAEFVGSEETLEILRKSGVNFGQGYHIGKPDFVDNLLPGEPERERATI